MDTFTAVVITIFALFLLAGFITMIVLTSADAGEHEGYRKAMKEIVELTRERQDISVYVAPEGDLKVGLIRARAIHDIEMEARAKLTAYDDK
jgi:hypothetical protein